MVSLAVNIVVEVAIRCFELAKNFMGVIEEIVVMDKLNSLP